METVKIVAYITVALVAVICGVIAVYDLIKGKKNKVVEKKVYIPHNTTEMFSILDLLIQQHLTYYISYDIKVQQPSFINNKQFETCVTEIVLGVYKQFSDDFKTQLYSYFSQEGLTKYITYKIYPTMAQLSIQTNLAR